MEETRRLGLEPRHSPRQLAGSPSGKRASHGQLQLGSPWQTGSDEQNLQEFLLPGASLPGEEHPGGSSQQQRARPKLQGRPSSSPPPVATPSPRSRRVQPCHLLQHSGLSPTCLTPSREQTGAKTTAGTKSSFERRLAQSEEGQPPSPGLPRTWQILPPANSPKFAGLGLLPAEGALVRGPGQGQLAGQLLDEELPPETGLGCSSAEGPTGELQGQRTSLASALTNQSFLTPPRPEEEQERGRPQLHQLEHESWAEDPFQLSNEEWCNLGGQTRVAQQLLDELRLQGSRLDQLEKENARHLQDRGILEQFSLPAGPLAMQCQCGRVHAFQPVAIWLGRDGEVMTEAGAASPSAVDELEEPAASACCFADEPEQAGDESLGAGTDVHQHLWQSAAQNDKLWWKAAVPPLRPLPLRGGSDKAAVGVEPSADIIQPHLRNDPKLHRLKMSASGKGLGSRKPETSTSSPVSKVKLVRLSAKPAPVDPSPAEGFQTATRQGRGPRNEVTLMPSSSSGSTDLSSTAVSDSSGAEQPTPRAVAKQQHRQSVDILKLLQDAGLVPRNLSLEASTGFCEIVHEDSAAEEALRCLSSLRPLGLHSCPGKATEWKHGGSAWSNLFLRAALVCTKRRVCIP